MCLVRTITAALLVSFLLLAQALPLPAFNMGYHYEMIREVGIKQGLSRDAWCVMLGGNSYIDLFQRSETEYIVDDDFCTCRDFIFRKGRCWHELAVRIAAAIDSFEEVDLWYQADFPHGFLLELLRINSHWRLKRIVCHVKQRGGHYLNVYEHIRDK